MKKQLALVCCLVMCISFAACGKAKSVDSYISSVQSDIDTMKKSMEGTGMELDVTARGNYMFYSFKLNIEADETQKTALSTAMDQQASTFQQGYTDLKKQVPSAESVVVEYLDKNGKVIVSKEYK